MSSSSSYTITRSNIVPSEHFEKALASKTFQEWLSNFDHINLEIKSIEIRDVDMFTPNLVGFIKFNSMTVVRKTQQLIPGIVFMRSPAVSVLILLVCNNDIKVVGVRQPRVPIGKSEYLELPAGMLDESRAFKGKIAKEMFEETGIEIEPNSRNLVDLSSLVFGSNDNGPDVDMGPSVGGCNETIKLFLYVKKVSKEYMETLDKRIIENKEHNTYEKITVELVTLQHAWRVFKDSKALSSLLYFQNLLEECNETVLNLLN
jgi:8-oxo-dGTP pyrophosphatase MutT (NUDIX family)